MLSIYLVRILLKLFFHKNKPYGVEDIYTPNGIENPVMPTENDDIYNDHTTSATWKPTWMNEREEI